MGRPMDYDGYSRMYAHTRSAMPWIRSPLRHEAACLPGGATLVEIGCGTGDYIISLAEEFLALHCLGLDLSSGMLAVARSRSYRVGLIRADADSGLPLKAEAVDFAFLVDVVHHLKNLDNLFREVFRVLKLGGILVIVTDSEENIRTRSLTRCFPEILQVELQRYPRLVDLSLCARRSGLDCESAEPAEGYFEIDRDFISRVEDKCSSAMRLISDEAHRAGVARLEEARRRGEKWFSCYTVLRFRKPRSHQ